ncbi:unnamed protein product [Candidula unifasciata]|uniref:LysM domain-containing protein n=1 Tax=Candidula unifasciata TaxID=100452 RepID=A0A8S3YIS3_9EUPU|nr:unnamed protein product [Candidula unifasciata]
MPRTKQFISRRLLRTDTLMGITLKYGVTIQDLKKENKLWNNDHLFLRETLLIPLTPENEGLLDENDTIVICDGSSSSTTSPSSPHSRLPNGDLLDSSLSSSSSQKSSGVHHSGSIHVGMSNGASTSSCSSSKPASSSSSSDFFAKYDTSIARLKGDVAKMEKNAAAGLSVASTIQRESRTLKALVPATYGQRGGEFERDLEESESVC